MSYHTRASLRDAVIKTIGLVNGTAVQTYTEPNIETSIQQVSDMIFRKKDWRHLCEWATYALDGTTGVVTTDLSNTVSSWENIRDIVVSGTDRRIVLPIEREHLHVNGATPLYYTPIRWGQPSFETGIVKFWPITATGSIDMLVKVRPADYTSDESVIPFPKDVMEYGCAWNVLANDGINPDATARAQTLYEVAYNDWVNEQTFPQGHGSRVRSRSEFVMGSTMS